MCPQRAIQSTRAHIILVAIMLGACSPVRNGLYPLSDTGKAVCPVSTNSAAVLFIGSRDGPQDGADAGSLFNGERTVSYRVRKVLWGAGLDEEDVAAIRYSGAPHESVVFPEDAFLVVAPASRLTDCPIVICYFPNMRASEGVLGAATSVERQVAARDVEESFQAMMSGSATTDDAIAIASAYAGCRLRGRVRGMESVVANPFGWKVTFDVKCDDPFGDEVEPEDERFESWVNRLVVYVDRRGRIVTTMLGRPCDE